MKLYRFHKNLRASKNDVGEQSLKCLEEAREIVQAVDGEESASRVMEEAWDCIQACEGVLRKFPALSVAKSFVMVKIKSARRRDYE